MTRVHIPRTPHLIIKFRFSVRAFFLPYDNSLVRLFEIRPYCAALCTNFLLTKYILSLTICESTFISGIRRRQPGTRIRHEFKTRLPLSNKLSTNNFRHCPAFVRHVHMAPNSEVRWNRGLGTYHRFT